MQWLAKAVRRYNNSALDLWFWCCSEVTIIFSEILHHVSTFNQSSYKISNTKITQFQEKEKQKWKKQWSEQKKTCVPDVSERFNFQTFTVLSLEPLAKYWPSGENAQQVTYLWRIQDFISYVYRIYSNIFIRHALVPQKLSTLNEYASKSPQNY